MTHKKQLFEGIKELLLLNNLSALFVGNEFAQRQHQLLIGERFADKAARRIAGLLSLFGGRIARR